MNKFGTIMAGLVLAFMSWSTAWAMDFSQMTNQELADLHGTITNAPVAEQAAYRQEWNKRLMFMSEEEKKQFPPLPDPPPEEETGMKKPYVLGQGYESQGTGTIIFGGTGSPIEENKGQGK